MRPADELRGVAEGGVEDAADPRSGVVPQGLGGLPQHPGEAYKRQGGEGEDHEHLGVEDFDDDHNRQQRGRPVGYLA